jgi:hypothetical protein
MGRVFWGEVGEQFPGQTGFDHSKGFLPDFDFTNCKISKLLIGKI